MDEVFHFRLILYRFLNSQDLANAGVPGIRMLLKECLDQCMGRVNNIGSTNLSSTIVGVLLAIPDLEQGFLPKDCLQSKEMTIGTENGDQVPLVMLSGKIFERLLDSDSRMEASVAIMALDFVGQDSVEVTKQKELSLAECGDILKKSCSPDNRDLSALEKHRHLFRSLLYNLRYCLHPYPKQKAAKIVTDTLNKYLTIENSVVPIEDKVSIVEMYIEWAETEKRVYLRQALEARLMSLQVDNSNFSRALDLGTKLLRELRRLDDKSLLMEIQLLESKAYFNVKNVAKSRAALTSARTTANAIYCPPKIQAALDLQSGILHAEEGDFKTSFSYFFEAFEGFDSFGDRTNAGLGLKYMLLSKIMVGNSSEVDGLLSGKLTLNYLSQEILAMQVVAKASSERSLAKFKDSLIKYETYLGADVIVKSHLETLYDDLLEKNLCKIIEPYSVVEILHVATLINLPVDLIEQKLSKMILDKTFHGILDQGNGNLIVFDESEADRTYEAALDTFSQMGEVVNSLYTKAKRLT